MIRNSLLLTSLFALLLPLTMEAGGPRVLKNASDAIQYARVQDRPLILFALIDASEGSRYFANLFNQNKLKLTNEEFVVSLCDAERRENINVFQNTFKLQPTSLPVVIITNPQGKAMAPSLTGIQIQDDYDRMIHAALVEAGLRSKDSPVISSTTGATISADSKVFKITKKDILDALGMKNEVRIWTLKSGESFRATFVKAEGTSGLFRIDGVEEPRRVVFDDLSLDDVEFLRKLLEES